MPERTEIEKDVRTLIATDVISRPLSSLGDKGIRRLDKIAKSIVTALLQAEDEEEEIGERVFARIEEKDEKKARTMTEGIAAFKEKYPEHGQILEGMIKEERDKHNRYLVYGLNKGYKMGEEDYIGVMMKLGFDRREASSVYAHILAVSERLGKLGEQAERKILVP